jgi:glutamine synthetase
MVGAGLDGIKKQIEPPPEVTDNIFSESNRSDLETLPASLEEALGALEKDTLMGAILGVLQKEFITLKKKEIQHYKTHISQWELEHYL